MNPSWLTMAARVALVVLALLLVPLVAMQVTDEVDWGGGDFLAAAVLLFGAGMSFATLSPRVRSRSQRAALALLIAAVLGIVWAQLAVGVFG